MSSKTRKDLLDKRPWYYRPVNRPWEEDGLIKISIRAQTTDRDLDPTAYFSLPNAEGASMIGQTLPNNAIAALKIFDFYGKYIQAASTISMAIPSVGIADPAAPGNNIHFFSRPMTSPLLLFHLAKSSVEAAPNKTWNISDASAAILEVYSEDYPITKFDRQIDEVSGMFQTFQEQSKYFDGSTTPSINFLQDYNRLVTASKKIKTFIEFNGLEYNASEDDKIRITFNADYHITNIILVQRGLEKHLFKGKQYFLKDTAGLNEPRINRLLWNLKKIYRLKTAKNIPPWSEFVKRFLPGVEVNFFGRPHSASPADEEAPGHPFASQEDIYAANRVLQDPIKQLQLLQDAQKKDPRRKDMEKTLEDVAKKMKEASDKVQMVREFLNKWGIMNLINAALECLAIKTGVTLPPIAGINPYDLMPRPISIKIPKLTNPLPTINIAKAIGDEIKQGLLDAAYAAVIGVTQTLAEIIVELCRDQDEEEEIGQGMPIGDLIGLYPQPTEWYTPGQEEPGIEGGLHACYEEFGITSEVGNLFLSKVAENVTARETCDLLNGAASDAVIDVIKNILLVNAEFGDGGQQSLRNLLPDAETIIRFFMCLGELVSDDYCDEVYSQPPINVDNVDPCTLEDLLADAVDPSIFDALLAAYEDPDNLMEGAVPDLGCGAGIVPAWANMPALNHSITQTFVGLFEVPKTTFINDISLLKNILLVPTPGCSTENAALFAELEKAGALPSPGPPRNALGEDISPSPEDKGSELLMSLFPGELLSNPLIANINNILNNATNPDTGSACAGVDITYKVAPGYQSRLANLDRKIRSPWLSAGSSKATDGAPDYNNMFFSITMIDYKSAEESTQIFFSPGEMPQAGSLGIVTGIYHYPWMPQQPLIAESAFKCDENVTNFSDGCLGRETLASLFETTVFDNYISSFNLTNPPLAGAGFGDPTLLRDACKRSLYFSAYLSLFNSLSYNIKNSKLFDVTNLKKLSLIPGKCPNGATFGNDLFDVDSIIQEALNEFEENACSDQTCAVGPIEDALIFAVLNAYIQILLLEQLLKNIFLLDAYGLGDFLTGTYIANNIIEEVYQSIGVSSVIPGAAHLEGLYSFKREMLMALFSASIIYVDKQRIRTPGPDGVATGAWLPDPHATLDNPLPPVSIPSELNPHPTLGNVVESIEIADLSIDERYGKYAFEYMIHKRLGKLADIINAAFGKPTGAGDNAFLFYGLPTTDVLDFPPTENLSAPSKPELVKSESYDDIFTWALQEPSDEADGSPTPINYDYGASLRHPGLMTDTISDDEARFAAGSGVFARENYVKVSVNMDNLNAMLAGDALTDGADPVAAAMEVQTNLYYADRIRDWLNDLLPIPVVGDTGEYKYEPGWNDIVISIDKFNAFVNQVKAEDTRPATSLQSLEVVYVVKTQEWSNPRKRSLNGDKGDRVPVILGLGCPTAECGDFADNHRDRRSKVLRSNYHAVKGPLRKNNYDALRFWWNEVQGASTTTDPVAHAGSEFYDSGLPIGEMIDTPTPDSYLRWNRSWDSPAGPAFLYPFVEAGTMTVPTEGLEGNQTRTDWISEEIALVTDKYQNLRNRINVKWGADYSAYDEGQIRYRVKKADLYPSDYHQAVWTGFPIWTLRGYDMYWFAAADIGEAWPAQNSAFAPGSLPMLPAGDNNGDGYVDWAVDFFAYPDDIDDNDKWLWYDGSDDPLHGSVDYASAVPTPGNPGIRAEVAGTFLPDWMVVPKLREGYASNTIPTPYRAGWDPRFFNSENVLESGDVWFSPSSQLRCQDPAEGGGPSGNPAASCPSYFGLGSGHFEVVGIYLNDSDIQEQIKTSLPSWEDFRAAMGDPSELNNEGSGTPAGGPSTWDLQVEMIPPDMAALMAQNMMIRLRYDGEDSEFSTLMMPRSTGYLTGVKEFDQAVTRVLKNVRVGSRIVYASPKMNDAHPVMTQLIDATDSPGAPVMQSVLPCKNQTQIDLILSMGGSVPQGEGCPGTTHAPDPNAPVPDPPPTSDQLIEQNYYKNKAGWLIDAGGGSRIWHVDTGIFGEVILATTISALEFSARTYDLQRLGGGRINRYQDTRKYDVVRPFINEPDTAGLRTMIADEITGDPRYTDLFKTAFDTNRLMEFLFMIGLRASNMLSNDFETMFNDTKHMLRILLRAALSGDDYVSQDSEYVSSSDAAANAALDLAAAGLLPFAQAGQSFILKMLIETPIRVLKALAEMIEPHVVVGKIIKDVSGQVINQVQQYADLIALLPDPNDTSSIPSPIGASMSEPLHVYMQRKINQDFAGLPKILQPKVNEEGLNLIGTVPYVLAIPPTPLGIAYILLNLQFDEELDPAVLEAMQYCPQAIAAPPPQLGTPPVPPSAPSSVYDCEDDDPTDTADTTTEDDDDDTTDPTGGGGDTSETDCT